MVGKEILHYKISEKLGEGGMGVVYKAEDTKLKRMVALKFLPSQALTSADEKERFQREAQAAAALSHAHIAHIYGLDEVDGQWFIAMEFIEGESLKKKLEKAPLKLHEAIKIAGQVADGLQAAHEKGIVHRDINPANIVLNRKGQAKITDFGLAKLRGRSRLTKTNMTLGTLDYMSPEQAQGADADHRADIWALGVVLYQMLTGQRPFTGEQDQVVMYSIAHEEPEPITALRSGVPMSLERIVNKSMAKDPRERYQHVDEVVVDLKAVEITSRHTVPVTWRTKSWKQSWRWWLGITIGLVLGILLSQWFRPTSSPSLGVARLAISLPNGVRLEDGISTPVAISPDGRLVVYVGVDHQGQRLYLRPMAELAAKPMAGTESAATPFFSPDGKWVGFFADDKLKRIAVTGGPAIAIADAAGIALGASWGTNDVIAFTLTFESGLLQVPAAGGQPKPLTKPDPEKLEKSHRHPHFLPDGKSLLYQQVGKDVDIWVLSLETGEKKYLSRNARSPHYLPSGYLTYVSNDGALLASPYDRKRFEITGPAVALVEEVGTTVQGASAKYAISASGLLVYFDGKKENSKLVTVNLEGKEQPLLEEVGNLIWPRFSPDGARLAMRISLNSDNSLWIFEIGQEVLSRLTSKGESQVLEWSHRGQDIFFSNTFETRNLALRRVASDFSSESMELVRENKDSPLLVETISHNDQWLVFTEKTLNHGDNLWALNLRSDALPQPILVTPFDEQAAKFSPNDHWLAYVSDESGADEVYIRPFQGTGTRRQISKNGGTEPVWGPDGQELFYRHGAELMAVTLGSPSKIKVAERKTLFENAGYQHSPIPLKRANYDIHPDGTRFVMVKQIEESQQEIIVILNWVEELKRLVPPGK